MISQPLSALQFDAWSDLRRQHIEALRDRAKEGDTKAAVMLSELLEEDMPITADDIAF